MFEIVRLHSDFYFMLLHAGKEMASGAFIVLDTNVKCSTRNITNDDAPLGSLASPRGITLRESYKNNTSRKGSLSMEVSSRESSPENISKGPPGFCTGSPQKYISFASEELIMLYCSACHEVIMEDIEAAVNNHNEILYLIWKLFRSVSRDVCTHSTSIAGVYNYIKLN